MPEPDLSVLNVDTPIEIMLVDHLELTVMYVSKQSKCAFLDLPLDILKRSTKINNTTKRLR